MLPSVDDSAKKCTVHLWRIDIKIWFYYTVFNGKVMLEYIVATLCYSYRILKDGMVKTKD